MSQPKSLIDLITTSRIPISITLPSPVVMHCHLYYHHHHSSSIGTISEPSSPIGLVASPQATFSSPQIAANFTHSNQETLKDQFDECTSKYQLALNSCLQRDYFAQFGIKCNPNPWNQSFGMERVWTNEFYRVFSSFYNELWIIQPVERKPLGIKMHQFVDSAKIRFCCQNCNSSWTSMKGRIMFWFNLMSPSFNIGIVTVRLFGQKCDSCRLEVYEQPMWYPEEVTKVLGNLHTRIGQLFYGFERNRIERGRRKGKPQMPHNKFLCQACTEGVCMARLDNKVTSSETKKYEIED